MILLQSTTSLYTNIPLYTVTSFLRSNDLRKSNPFLSNLCVSVISTRAHNLYMKSLVVQPLPLMLGNSLSAQKGYI